MEQKEIEAGLFILGILLKLLVMIALAILIIKSPVFQFFAIFGSGLAALGDRFDGPDKEEDSSEEKNVFYFK